MPAIWHPSPNFGPRRGGLTPTLIVLHYTAMAPARAALGRLCDPGAEVSAHYLIGAGGSVWQMVEEPMRAWHAGAGEWRGLDDINSRSIGIELDNLGSHPFAEPQMAALERLLAGIMARWGIGPAGVIGHSDMAPERKCDPGPRFDWRRLARAGLAVWPKAEADAEAGACAEGEAGGDMAAFLRAAHRFGYPRGASAEAVLGAFRRRFRPWDAAAPLGRADVAAIADLAERFAVDRGRPNT